jgi:hypothetical protein
MNNMTMNLHTVRATRVQRRCINGTWQLSITAAIEDDSQVIFTLFADTREALELVSRDDEHVRITDVTPAIEYSDKPFDMLDNMSGGDNADSVREMYRDEQDGEITQDDVDEPGSLFSPQSSAGEIK